jgi:hypothetical protein
MGKFRAYLAALAALFLLTVAAVAADDSLSPSLDKYVKLPPERQDPAYVPTRCAGLYVGILRYAGKSLDPDQRENIEKESSALALAAMQVRATQKGGEPPDYSDAVLGVVRALSDQYLNRMKDNQAKSGQAFMNDDLIKSDIAFCKQVATLVPPVK